MEQDAPSSLLADAAALLSDAMQFLSGFAQPGWRLYQLGIIAGLVLLAYLLRLWLGPVMHNWMRGLGGRPKWQLRFLLNLHKRMQLILFALLAWAVYLVMQNVTWPSRSYVVGLAATLSTVWALISLATPYVRNPLLRRLVRWGLWIYATLYYLNVLDEVTAFLDRIAFQAGTFRISALSLLSAIVLIGALLIAARIASRATSASIRRNEDMSPSMQVLLVKAVQFLLYGAAFFMGVKAVGIDLTGLAVVSGAIGVGLGFGLQKVVSNLVSGFIILLDKSVKPGDVISLGDTFGWINTLGSRYVSITTRDGKEYLIPNEDLITSQVVNWSHSNEFVRLDINFGTSYGDDPHLVRRLAIEAAQSVERVLEFKSPVCHITSFGDSSIDYVLRFWIRDPSSGLTNIRGAVFLALWDAFKENGVQIPFPQREVRLLDE